MSQRVIYTREERKAQALDAGLKLAQVAGVKAVSVSAIARECGVTAPLLFHIFGDRDSVHRAIQAHARKKKVKLPTATAARKRSVAEVKAIKKTAARKPAAKKAARKPVATTKKPKAPASAKAAGSTRKAAGGRSAAAKTAGSKRKTTRTASAGSGKRFKVQPPPTTADVATPGDAPAA